MQIEKINKHISSDKYKIAQEEKYIGDDCWEWAVWIEANDNALDKIDNVLYNLHYTFPEPVRIIKTRENKFKLETSGWGTFTIYARVNFKDSTVLELEHELELHYPDGEETEA
jgi:transcription initiation factor IIF auxiliary subunit